MSSLNKHEIFQQQRLTNVLFQFEFLSALVNDLDAHTTGRLSVLPLHLVHAVKHRMLRLQLGGNCFRTRADINNIFNLLKTLSGFVVHRSTELSFSKSLNRAVWNEIPYVCHHFKAFFQIFFRFWCQSTKLTIFFLD